MSNPKVLAGVLTLCLLVAGGAEAKPLNIVFTTHGSTTNPFWQAVQKGFDDACKKVEATCRVVYNQTDGSVAEQQANIQTVIAENPDGLVTSIIDDTAFNELIKDARAKGIIVIAANNDDTQGAKGNARQAYVGQNLFGAGYVLGQALSAHFPKEGPIHVLIGVSQPGANYAQQRSGGILKFLDEYKTANPNRSVTVDKIDSGADFATTSDRVGAYLSGHPETNVYFDTGYWDASVARLLADRGVPAGKVAIGGFDLVRDVLEQMKNGYIQIHIDQQPYAQGFMPVIMIYLAKTYGLAPMDVDTGLGIITPDQVDAIVAFSQQGVR